MKLDDCPFDPSPTDVDRKLETPTEEDEVSWDGIPMTSAELADEMNAMARGEIPMPTPRLKELSEEEQRMLEDLEPFDVAMDYPWAPLYPEDDDPCRSGICETMEDTLPELEIILENECVL
jgi:hypothetical protein